MFSDFVGERVGIDRFLDGAAQGCFGTHTCGRQYRVLPFPRSVHMRSAKVSRGFLILLKHRALAETFLEFNARFAVWQGNQTGFIFSRQHNWGSEWEKQKRRIHHKDTQAQREPKPRGIPKTIRTMHLPRITRRQIRAQGRFCHTGGDRGCRQPGCALARSGRPGYRLSSQS